MTKRVRTGVAGLDKMLAGGFLEGSSALLQGAAGTGKTTLGLQFLYTGAVEEGEPGLLVTFEEFPYSLYRDAQAHGWDLQALEDANQLRILFTSPQVLLSSLQSPSSPVNRTIIEWGVRRVVLDSISHFSRVTQDPSKLRDIYNMVINALKRERITSLSISEDSTTRAFQHQGHILYIVDTIMMMRYVEVNSAMERAIFILKMRGSEHSKDIHHFEIRKEGIAVTETFQGLQGLLTGTPSHTVRWHG